MCRDLVEGKDGLSVLSKDRSFERRDWEAGSNKLCRILKPDMKGVPRTLGR